MSIAEEFGLDVRPVNSTCHVHDRPPSNASVALEWVTTIDDDGVTRPPLAMVQTPNDDSRWFVLSRKGIVTEYSNGQVFTKVGVFLDIADRVTLTLNGSSAEFGALGIAFHPDFQENGHVFIYYTAAGAPHVARLSRFTSSDGGATLDPSTEEILLSHELSTGVHVGGNLAFGPDDYLYLGIGDGGNWLNAQDLNSLKGKLLRIDVDNGDPYAIPVDNPWAGGGGRGEIYALGLRNPWRWSFDKVSGELWLGDVGSSTWEEIDLIVKGGNYGWPFREGARCFNNNVEPCATAGLINPGGLIDPVTEYSHEGGSAAVLGGFVYRGSSIPNLEGIYLFMDLVDGRLWALLYDEQGNPTPEVILEAGPGYLSFAEGNDGELYLARYDKIDRLIAQGIPPQNTFPQSLSQTGCVDPSDPTRPAQGLIPFGVNAPLWSDGAVKERWVALPDNQTIHINEASDWEFPVGTVLIKSFRLADKLIETRLLMRHLDGGWAGYSYEWDDNQTEAYLLPAAKTKTIGGQVWKYPSRGQCMQCHTQAAGITLGPETAQLNGQFIYPSTGRQANQLETLEHIGMFDAALPDSVGNLPQLARIEDESQSVALRARAYLHANCSMCHQPGGPGQGPEDFRYTTADVDMGAINVLPTQNDFQIADARLLSPEHPEKSIISYRIHTLDLGRMPPLGSSIVDLQGSNLIDSWILQMVDTGTLIDNGDTTIDTASGLEWLDLTLTQGVSAQDLLAGFGGYIEAGWTFATVDQVCGLFGALGDDTTGCPTGAAAVPMDPTNAETLVNLLGNTVATGRGAYGMFNNIGGFPYNFGLGCINDTATSCTGGGASSWRTLIEWASGYQTVGSFLVRPVSTIPLESYGDLNDNGDTTIDTGSGLEWLDLTLTQGVSAQDLLAGFGGYIEAGWTFATVDQVCGLFGALGDDTTGCPTGAAAVPMDLTNAETLVNLLGNTVETGRGAYGMFNNIGGFPNNFGLGCINDTATSCTGGGASSWLTKIGWASGYQTVGSFLVRPDWTTTLIDNGYTTIDTASGLEWLDLTLTRGVSAQDVLAGFGGYIDAGWTFATVDQVCGLFGALGDDTTGCPTGAAAVPMDPTNAETLVNLLGDTAATGRGAYGMFSNIDSFPNNFGIGCIDDTATSCTGGGASSWLTLIEWASGFETVGSFLVREVTEPAPDADGDGVPDASDQCLGTPAGTTVDADGCPLATNLLIEGENYTAYWDSDPGSNGAAGNPDDDGDGVSDASDKCSGTPGGTNVDADGCPLVTNLLIEGEDYTAYWDSDPGSNGAAGNPGDDVDIEATTDIGGGRNFGWTVAGEWLEYQVNLSAGVYAVETRVASQVSTGAYDLLLDGMVFGSNTVPSTGGWQLWETHSVGRIIVATSGLHTLRVNVTGNDFNLNWIELTRAADADDFGLVFMTSQTFDGDLGGILGADEQCNAAAAAAGLAGTYVAWISDSATDAGDMVTDQGYITIAGDIIATSLAYLIDGAIGEPINVDENGIPILAGSGIENEVWTNTSHEGLNSEQFVGGGRDACSDWTSTASYAAIGRILEMGVHWGGGGSAVPCTNQRRLYCFGQ